MASMFEDLVRGNAKSGYCDSVKKSQEFGSDYAKCRGCPNVSIKCPKPECFKGGKKKKKK